MALVQSPDGVTHYPDFIYGGTLCGKSWEGWKCLNPPHGDATCVGCMTDDDEEGE